MFIAASAALALVLLTSSTFAGESEEAPRMEEWCVGVVSCV
jgi:hypothetical protein